MDFKLKSQVMDAAGIGRVLSRLASEIVERNAGINDLLLVGIRRRGVPLAERIADKIEQLEGTRPLTGQLDITLYRDDLSTVGPRPVQKPHPPIWTGGSAETALKRAGTWADGFICGSSAIPDFPSTWEKIAGYARAAGRDPNKISKAGLTFMAIDEDQSKAVKTVEDYVMRYYGRLRADVANTSLVGAPAAIADRIGAFLSRGLDTLIIGVADPDPRQLDLFGENVLPKIR